MLDLYDRINEIHSLASKIDPDYYQELSKHFIAIKKEILKHS